MRKKTAAEMNEVKITGLLEKDAEYAYTSYDEKFYSLEVTVKRDNPNNKDIIPVTVSEKLIDCSQLVAGTCVHIEGQFRSFNKVIEETQKRQLVLSVFTKEIEIVDPTEAEYQNAITMTGFICKDIIYRQTPLGREIGDMLVAVNRAYGKTDYIPCIAWGRNARFSASMKVGAHIAITGRIQSREYKKKLSEDTFEMRTAYEVSISKLNYVDGCEEELGINVTPEEDNLD